jgi:hypothetical protein
VQPTRLDVGLLEALLDTTGFAVVVLAGIAILVRWRLTGEAPHFYISVALLLYGIVTVGGAILVPLLYGVSPPWADALRIGGRLAAVGLLIYALRAPAVDSSLRPGRAPQWPKGTRRPSRLRADSTPRNCSRRPPRRKRR